MKWVDTGNSKASTSSEKTSSKKAITATAKKGKDATRTEGNLPDRVGGDSNVSK